MTWQLSTAPNTLCVLVLPVPTPTTAPPLHRHRVQDGDESEESRRALGLGVSARPAAETPGTDRSSGCTSHDTAL